MSAVIPESVDAPQTESGVSLAELVDSPRIRTSGFARKYILSAVIWVLYVPHYAILRLLGPRFGIVWVRVAANLHWLLTFVGAQRATRRGMVRLHPVLGTHLTVSQMLRRHLQMKHECFARVRVYNLHGAHSEASNVQWRVHPDCVSAVPVTEGRERGLVIVGYHFGFFQLVATALSQLVPGCNPVQLRYRIAQCTEQAMSPVARMVMRRAIEADRRSGAAIFYFDPDTSLRQIFRLLRSAGCIALAADGMLADDFVEVPFFDGTLRVPMGWARLAATTSSDILLLYDTKIDRHNRDTWFFNYVHCPSRSADSAERAVAEAIHALELAIRREPWAWHPWQRLQWEGAADGSPRYYLRQFGAATDDSSAQSPSTNKAQDKGGTMDGSTNQPQAARNDGARRKGGKTADAISTEIDNRITAPAHEYPGQPAEVAIICNSLTPYRIHLHSRIVDEVPDIKLWSLTTHTNAYNRWSACELPAAIRPTHFGRGEPTNEQARMRYSFREWQKGGQIIEWLRKHNIAAVFCQGCGDLGRLRILHHCYRYRIPCFLYGDFNICGDRLVGPKRWLKQTVYERAVNWSTGLMPCGIRGTELFARYGGAKKPKFLFPFTPDTGEFEWPSEDAINQMRQRFALRPDRRRIVFSARLMRAKRPDLAVQAFAAIAAERPEWDLVMLGDGDLRLRLQQQVPAALRDRVVWTGFLDNVREVAALYALGDVLVLPSDHEPWGVVVAEAAAAGMAIVASDVVGAAPELVRHERNGFQFSAGSIDSLVAALRRCTAADWIDDGKDQSRKVLHDWFATSDPVAGFCAALNACGLALPSNLLGEAVGRVDVHSPHRKASALH